jgi:serine/threonine protein kinase
MHSKNLIHRDIKAENVLISNEKNKKGSNYITKICDLGFCREDDESVNTFCGTTNYMAPEIFEKKTYDLKVDIWALGVLIFSMLFGEFPFKGMNLFYEITTKCEKGFNLKAMKTRKNVSISKNDQEMLHQLFNETFRIDPTKRIAISDLQKYKWFVTEKSSRNTTT